MFSVKYTSFTPCTLCKFNVNINNTNHDRQKPSLPPNTLCRHSVLIKIVNKIKALKNVVPPACVPYHHTRQMPTYLPISRVDQLAFQQNEINPMND